jgi:site-specific recombinase XerD
MAPLLLAQDTHAARTRVEYGKDWRRFEAWCTADGYSAMPASADTVIRYAAETLERGGRLSSVRRYVTAINDRHRRQGEQLPDPDRVQRFLANAQRLLHDWPRPKTALSIEHLRAICARLTDSASDTRARCILTLGFASALRRCNLVALDLADIAWVPQGIVIRVRYEKQDQCGRGRVVGILRGQSADTCPVRALEAWLKIRGGHAGPLFTGTHRAKRRLGPQGIANEIKRAVRLIGLDPRAYAGHSLRSGFVTRAIEAGAPEVVIAHHTGHRSLSSLQRYFRMADPFRVNPSGLLGL